MAPDPCQEELVWFKTLAALSEPRLVGWAARAGDIEAVAHRLRSARVDAQEVREGWRKQPDGKTLRWKTMMLADDRDGLLPFIIEWSATSAHPAEDAPTGCRLEQFEITSPDHEILGGIFEALGIDSHISHGPVPGLRALIANGTGSTELVS